MPFFYNSRLYRVSGMQTFKQLIPTNTNAAQPVLQAAYLLAHLFECQTVGAGTTHSHKPVGAFAGHASQGLSGGEPFRIVSPEEGFAAQRQSSKPC